MGKRLFSIVLTLGLLINVLTLSSTVYAERTGTGQCSITITTDNGGGNFAQASGPCNGFIEGYYVYQDGHVFGVTGSLDTVVENGGKYRFNLPPTAGDFYDYELTVTTIVKKQPEPKPDPKPEPKPEPKPDPKPEPVKPKPEPVKEKPKEESKPSTTKPSTTQPKDSNVNIVEKPKVNDQPKKETKVENKDGKNFASTEGVKTEVEVVEKEKAEDMKESVEKEEPEKEAENVEEPEDKEGKEVEVNTADEIEVAAKADIDKPQKENKAAPLVIAIIVIVIIVVLGLSYFHPIVRNKVKQALKRIFKKE